MASFRGIGCMSGSSLDGLDICLVEFTGDKETDIWGYRILESHTEIYHKELLDRLRNAGKLPGEELIKLHADYGHYIGREVLNFLESKGIPIASVDFIASHGHTVFHQPDQGFTFQLGDGETTSSYFSCPYVCNFRNKDVALGGQGAPLVPCGEKHLFSPNAVCINLGGIANIGLKGGFGYDVCPCNYVMNRLAKRYDEKYEFDNDGDIAKKGEILQDIFDKLNALSFYSQKPPKSLGAEWIEGNVLPLLDTGKYSIPDLMRTYVEHVATRLVAALEDSKVVLIDQNLMPSSATMKVLLTGGGAFNKFLMDLLRQKLQPKNIQIVDTDYDTICYKEALIFAFLGLRCLLGQENVLCAVTGSKCDSTSGSIHRPIICPSNPSKFEKYYFEIRRHRSTSVPSEQL